MSCIGMNRQQAVGVVLVVAGLVGAFAWWRPVRGDVATTCPDGGLISLSEDGVASCEGALPLHPGQALTVGQHFDCNRATAEELALVPGVGHSLAEMIVAARGDAGFVSWDDVDAIPGVGAARLAALQAACDITARDAGLW